MINSSFVSTDTVNSKHMLGCFWTSPLPAWSLISSCPDPENILLRRLDPFVFGGRKFFWIALDLACLRHQLNCSSCLTFQFCYCALFHPRATQTLQHNRLPGNEDAHAHSSRRKMRRFSKAWWTSAESPERTQTNVQTKCDFLGRLTFPYSSLSLDPTLSRWRSTEDHS